MILYIHGFNSSAASVKSGQLRDRLAEMGREDEFVCPDLPDYPADAMSLLERIVGEAGARKPTLVGSSLGGFYATWLTETMGCRSVLVNPAINPHVGLRSYLGPQTNLYTGREYELTESHLVQMKSFYVPKPVRMENYMLIHTTGDELLDWRIAEERYRGARQIIVAGSDHGFVEFAEYIDCVLDFCGRSL